MFFSLGDNRETTHVSFSVTITNGIEAQDEDMEEKRTIEQESTKLYDSGLVAEDDNEVKFCDGGFCIFVGSNWVE